MPALADLAQALELSQPSMIVADPESYVPAIARFMENQVVTADDQVWIVTRLGYLIGEVLVQRLSGRWTLNEWPETRYFMRYVVGEFGALRNQGAMADPFEAAEAFVLLPPGRNLQEYLGEIERALRAA